MSTGRPLGRTVHDHYASQSLRPEALARLRVMARTHPRERLPSRRAVYITSVCGALAIVAMTAGILLPYWGGTWGGHPPISRSDAVIDEVRALHVAAHEPEILAGSYEDLTVMSASLGFEPREPQRLADRFELRGARRCVVAGQPAAELALIDGDGETATLYQMVGVHVPAMRTHTLDRGLSVSMWHEDEYLYCLVTP